jgi:hypothetical protein
MVEPSLSFISRQLERVIAEQASARDEMRLLREEVRITRAALGRLEDTIVNDVLDRLRALEASRS